MTEINILVGKIGDKVKIDNKIITLQNSYKLLSNENGNENGNKYYEIETNNKIIFKINEIYLLKIINVTIDECNYYTKWFNKDNKIYTNVNNRNINIVKYLLDKINDTKFRYSIKNNDIYDYRFENITILNPSKKNTKDRFTKINFPTLFYKPNEIRIIKEFEGHKLSLGPHSEKYNNNYRLIEIINEPDQSKKRYYEMFLGVYDNEESNNKFSFIFDEASLPKILNLSLNNISVENPSWLMATNQYIWCRISNHPLIYLHRYLMNCVNGDKKTIDHINNNKLDNRLSNLRIATMTEQNMNRPNVTRKHDLNSILNPTPSEPSAALSADPATAPPIPPTPPTHKIETKSLLFINKKNTDGLEYFALEISKARTRDKEIKVNSSKSNLLTLKEKLGHIIYKRYEYICQYPIIMKEQIDGKIFTTLDEFKLHSETKLNEILNSITYTLDSFLDYLNTKKIPKYLDPRIKARTQVRLQTNTDSVIQVSDSVIQAQVQTQTQSYIYTYKSDDKFTFIDNGKTARDLTIKISKNIKENIRVSGLGSKKFTNEDKLCHIILNRYFVLIEHENAINIEIHKENINNINNITINKNTTGKKTLTDLEIEGNKFKNFQDFSKHTIKIIKDIMTSIPSFSLPDNVFTIETINQYFIDKIKDKRCNKPIPILNTKFPILTI